jgi:hypothetical protein
MKGSIFARRVSFCVAIVFLLSECCVVAWAQFRNIKRDGQLVSTPTPSNSVVTSQSGVSSHRRERRPAVGPNIQVNAPQGSFAESGFLGRSETAVATTVSGRDILVGFNDGQGWCGPPFGAPCEPQKPPGLSGYAFSTDGGLSFTDAGAPDPVLFDNVFTRGDPWLDRGGFDNATFFFANLAVDATTQAGLGVSVHRGHFVGNGFAFTDVRTFTSTNPNNPYAYDKEAIAAAKDGSGAAYVSVTDWIEVCGIPHFGAGQIELWRTHDGGDSWQGPTIVSPDMTFVTDPTDPSCGMNGTVQQGSVPAIGPNGELYVAWLQGPTFTDAGISTNARIEVAASFDGGVTFGSPATVASTNVSFVHTAPAGYNNPFRMDSPRIAVATGGPHAGRVYVTFTSETRPATTPSPVQCPAGLPEGSFCVGQDPLSEEAFLSFSDDGGSSWSTPTRIAPAVPVEGVKRMWPVLTLQPGGNMDVIYYESHEIRTAGNPDCVVNIAFPNGFRVGPRNSLVDTFWVHSENRDASFTAPVKITTATSNWCTTVSGIGPNFGDYISSFATAGRVFACWSDGRNGVPDTFCAAILESRKRLGRQ